MAINPLTTITPVVSSSPPPPNTPIESGYKYILAYVIFISIMILITKTRAGYRIVYYTLVLVLFLILVTESKFIADTLAPISNPVSIQTQLP